MWPFSNKTVNDVYEKLNPAQSEIVDRSGDIFDSNTSFITHQTAYNQIEVVRRGTDLIVNSSADILVDIGDKINNNQIKLRPKKLRQLLNFGPNQFITANEFKANVFMDLVIEGNAFIYWDGANLFNLPACNVEVLADKKTFIKGYRYSNTTFSTEEIIHIKDNNASSIFRGASRLNSANKSINILNKINDFQDNFFKNSAIPGLVLKTPHVLSKRVKDRIILEWQQRFNPRTGGRKPVILDGDFDLKSIADFKFTDLDFANQVETNEVKILEALGVPPVLLKSGNNANISPNLRLFYISTVMPLYGKFVAGLERFFGFDIKPVTQSILALQPDLRDLANFHSTLTNAGIFTRNESREALRKPRSDQDFADQLILPQNVAGSNANPSVGGRPKK